MTVHYNRRPGRIILASGILMILSALIFTTTASAQSRNAALELQNAFREISSDVRPVVVQVNTVNIIERRTVNPFEFFFRFPNSPKQNESPQTQSFRQEGLGSGVIVERRGNREGH